MQMIEAVDAFNDGDLELGKLCSDLKGLLGASDLKDTTLIDEFWNHFVEIDAEHELRTEAWGRKDLASDTELRASLDRYKAWVKTVIAATSDERT